MAKKKKADQIRELYNLSNNWTRSQWQYVNQKGYEFAHDEQLSHSEKTSLQDQGMPTFTINRILPVVEMLNFYATANSPRWQAIGIEGSDSDVAAVFSDLSDYIWHLSDGTALYSNAINDAICKSIGYILVTVDTDRDNGMGEVIIQQPEPFDIYVDPKSRDMMFRDASFVLIRKVLPKSHVIKLFPQYKRKIGKASSLDGDHSYSERAIADSEQKLFLRDDSTVEDVGIDSTGEQEPTLELFELYEKIKISYANVFYRIPPDEKQLQAIQQQVQVKMKEMAAEMEVELLEQQKQMQQAVQEGKMIPERYELEMQKAQEMMGQQLQSAEQEYMSQLQAEASRIENKIISEKEYNILLKDETFQKSVVDSVQFYGTRIRQTICAGDKLLHEIVYPENIVDYPLIPFHYKWTGTPYPVSAVSPLIGKQKEINKSHQIMVHNASLGSSLRWLYEEGSIDPELWEQYSSSPGALLPIRAGSERPTPIMPAPLSNAFFGIVQEGKADMEYLAGIYSSMQGDTQQQHETFRGMLALDEYGTRRIKQWMKHSIEPALRQLGKVVMQISQSVYSANKRFRIIQPSAIQEQRQQEINIPIYNDMGEAIGKSMDYSAAKFDVRIVAGSTLPVNRWAYLAELKELLQFGVIDDIAVLAETDVRNKEQIAKRKSLYAQLQGQLGQLQEALKDKEGTIETLERQLVQAGIKGKVMQAEMEITKKKEEVKGDMKDSYRSTEAKQKLLQNVLVNQVDSAKKDISRETQFVKKGLQNENKNK
jgi:hypothetical protein|tara:strand:- start:223 stop:2520 length:2298 start_codon:yes stop_codon:yes gene_type:complete